jgi:hypothetical protein
VGGAPGVALFEYMATAVSVTVCPVCVTVL